MDLTPKKHSEFRMWVHQLWIENIEENLTYGGTPYKINEYWNTYKWWLKREYKYRQRNN
jgi:hypothetical protein